MRAPRSCKGELLPVWICGPQWIPVGSTIQCVHHVEGRFGERKNVLACLTLRGEGLECSKRAENIINREITIFYIEAIPPKNCQLRKKYFCSDSKKSFSEIFENHRQKFSKSQIVGFWKSRFWSPKNVDFFFVEFRSEKKYFFSIDRPTFFFRSWKFFWGYSFDVKNYVLLIYDVFSTFWAL